MKYCREMFLKCPPAPTSPTPEESQPLDKDSTSTDDSGTRKKGKRRHRRRQQFLVDETSPDDSANWVTDHEESSDTQLRKRRWRRKKYNAEQDQIQMAVMKEIYNVQSQDVKDVINDLYRLHLRQERASIRKMKRPRLLLINRPKKIRPKYKIIPKKLDSSDKNSTNIGFSANVKILSRLQRRHRNRRKPRSKKYRHKKFPRRRRRKNAKKGNRQGRKRYLRVQKLFEKGIFLAGRKLLDEVWAAVKDPTATATSFCNNNTHGLSKIHKKQIELYERIEEDLQRLDVTRQERAEAALERKAKEQEKEAITQEGFQNKIEARAAARMEQDLQRRQRRAARKQRAFEKKTQKEKAKHEGVV